MNKTINKKSDAILTCSKTTALPVVIKRFSLSAFPNRRASFTWSSEVTFIHILNGAIRINVNNCEFCLYKNEIIIIDAGNNCQLTEASKEDCRFAMIYVGTIVYKSMAGLADTRLKNPLETARHILLTKESPQHHEFVHMLDRIDSLLMNKPVGYDFEILAHLFMIASKLHCIQIPPETTVSSTHENADAMILREMIIYIQEHYSEKIFLDDIASSGKICRSKCCSLFRKFLNQSPIEYLNDYRLSVSQDYLLDHTLSIASVAVYCGFSHQSYFTKLFTAKYSYTPYEFRKGMRMNKTDSVSVIV